MRILGIDTGGTFTDFALLESGTLRIHKVLSTPRAPEQAILRGITELGLDLAADADELLIIHGSTVATNAVLEGKGVRTVYVANRGLADLLTIGRQARRELYNLQPLEDPAPVPAELCLEVDTRCDARGQLIHPLSDRALNQLVDAIRALAPEAVAVNLLFSWRAPQTEQAIRAALPETLFCSLSNEVVGEIREYERGIATWLNARVGPLMQGYLQRLEQALRGRSLAIMQSSGETIAADLAGQQAVRLLLSGPAGGLIGAAEIGRLADQSQLLTFDMGGTSTDVAVVDGEPALTDEGHLGRWPVILPMVDLHTIGAGGGSIARVDEAGLLLVGPESAGADPGPACYAQGGRQATVTDANLVLGRLVPECFLGGRLRLDPDAARHALQPLAEALHCDLEQAALGVVRLANDHMVQALRVISVRRGLNPARFSLASFGGAGGLHVCALAQALGMHSALVPIHAGVLSALGMTVARPGRRLSSGCVARLEQVEDDWIELQLGSLLDEGRRQLASEGVVELESEASLDLRYLGQSTSLTLPWRGRDASARAFEQAHEERYGHRLDLPIELVNLNLAVRGPSRSLNTLRGLGERAAASPFAHRNLPDREHPVPVFRRDQLAAGQVVAGPALVVEEVSTTWLESGWELRVDLVGNLLLHRSRAA